MSGKAENGIEDFTTAEAAEKLGCTPTGLSTLRRSFEAYTRQTNRATYWNRALVESAYQVKANARLGLRRSLEEAAKAVPPKGGKA